MNTQRLLIATLVGGLAYFLAGWLLYGFLFKNQVDNFWTPAAKALEKPQPDMPVLILSCLVGALLLTFIFERWANIRTWKTGAIAGAIIVGLVTLNFDLSIVSMTTFMTGIGAAIIDSVLGAVLGAITGAAVGFALGYNRS